MIIFVIGFMGSGKSTLGKRLASKLGLPFIDSDKEISKELNLSIADIFEQKGEKYFRDYEKKWLQNLKKSNTVVALGGGTPCQEGNMQLINELGTSIYLILSTGALATRLSAAKSVRPLIEPFRGNPKKMKEFIASKLIEREEFYNQALIKFEAENVDAEKMQLLIDMIKLSSRS